MRQTLPITLLLAALPAYSADFLPTLHRITEPVTDDGKTIAELCDRTDYDNNNLKIDLEYLASNNNTINHTINRLEQVRVNYTSFIELEKDNPYESQRHFLFDESGKHIQLADLLTYGGDNALQAPLHRAWNAHKGVEDTIISDKKIPLAKNIYFTAVGLVFHYQQEDKPARSKMNNPQILIPFAELTTC